MARSGLARPAVGMAAVAATVGLAFDAGGFHALAWDRALVLLAAAALGVLLLAGAEPPGRYAAVMLAALALLTGWTAASWLWSDSPPAAPVEAQRTGAYLAAALAVVVVGRRVPLGWFAGGVAAGIVPVACWNLAVRLAPDWTGRAPLRFDPGQLADPVGYSNALAVLDAIGLLLLVGAALIAPGRRLRTVAAILLVPLAADLGVLQSEGGVAAFGAGVLALLLAGGVRTGWRATALLVLPAAALVAVAHEQVVVAPPPGAVLSAAAPGHRLLLVLALLVLAQGALAWFLPSELGSRLRVPWRLGAATAAVAVAAVLVAAPFALRGHERAHYWRVAAHEIAARPLLGSGAGTYVDWWTRTRTVLLATQSAHSLYLETLAELGPVGLLLVLAALGAPLAAAVRLRRTRWGPAVLAALVVYDVHVAVDFDWELAGVTLPVIVLGAAAAVHASRPAGVLAPRARAGVTLATAALAAAGILALAGTAPLSSAQAAATAGRFDAAIADARRALRFAPWSADAWRVIGESRLAEGDRAGARAAFRTAVRLDPSGWQTWAELASVSAGEPRRAALAEAARLNPLVGSG